MPSTIAAPLVRLPGEGETFWFADNRMTMKARACDTRGAYGLLESWVRASCGPPLHVHRTEDEAFWILEGELLVVCGDQEVRAGAASYVFLPRDIPHTFQAGDTDVHLLTLISPGGGEQFFVDGAVGAQGPGLPPQSVTDIPRMVALSEDYGTEILGPPLAVSRGRR
jgi:mannose-6-phosphate isomerase-like protein (cupin superfamily)